MIGYNSSNPDPLKIRRNIKVTVTRRGLESFSHTAQYTIKPTK